MINEKERILLNRLREHLLRRAKELLLHVSYIARTSTRQLDTPVKEAIERAFDVDLDDLFGPWRTEPGSNFELPKKGGGA